MRPLWINRKLICRLLLVCCVLEWPKSNASNLENQDDEQLDEATDEENVMHFTSEWVVRLKEGKEAAEKIARENGYENVKQVCH